MTAPLIVGESPSRSNPEPLNCRSGLRLARLCGLSLPDFLDAFERLNVFPANAGRAREGERGDSFPLAEATQAAQERVLPLLAGRRAVLLGRAAVAVRKALERSGDGSAVELRRLEWRVLELPRAFRNRARTTTLAACPHPSGIVRWWNSPENVERAKAFWQSVLAG